MVVGYIVEVQEKKWRVDISSRQDANLPLTSVNLPGGEQRRYEWRVDISSRQDANLSLFFGAGTAWNLLNLILWIFIE